MRYLYGLIVFTLDTRYSATTILDYSKDLDLDGTYWRRPTGQG